MDLASLRSAVREALEVDEDEIPDPMLDRWLEEGFDRIVDADQRWTWLEHTWTYQWPSGTASVSLDDIGDSEPIRNLTSVVVSGDRFIRFVGHDEAEAVHVTTTGTGTPAEWSVFGSKLYLWPTPSSAQLLQLRGFREPTPFYELSSGASPDMPRKFHKLLVSWALHAAYERDEDPEMSAYHRQHFEDAVIKAQRDDRAIPAAQPLVMGGSRRRGLHVGPQFPFDY
jgi:hypothetical protein